MSGTGLAGGVTRPLVDLNEFAPVSYLSISAQGMIDTLNSKAAFMANIEPKQLIKHAFANLVTKDTRDYCRRQSIWMKSLASVEEHRFELKLNQKNEDVVAEGVASEEQRQYLLDNGCTYYQGYLFSKPLPIDEFESLPRKG